MNKKLLITSIYMASLMQMAGLGVSPALSGIAAAFPNTNITVVQLIITMPGLFVIISSIVVGIVSGKISKKRLIVMGLGLVLISGLGAFFIHFSIGVLLFWAALLGIGVGMFCPMLNSAIAQHFQGEERAKITGRQGSFINLGGVILTFAGGLLCSIGWHYNYLVFLFCILGIVAVLIGFPKEEKKQVQLRQKRTISKEVIIYIVLVTLLIILYQNMPINISIYITEKGIGNSSVAGTAISIMFLGGVLSGVVYGFIQKKLRDYVIPIGFLFLAVGMIGLAYANSLGMLFVGMFLGGASVNFIVVQSIYRVSVVEKESSVPLSISIIVAMTNFAQFASNIITWLSRIIFGNDDVQSKYLLCGILAIIILLFTLLLLFTKGKKAVFSTGANEILD